MFRGRLASVASAALRSTASPRLSAGSRAVASLRPSLQAPLLPAFCGPVARLSPLGGFASVRSFASDSGKELANILKEERKFESENPLDESPIKEFLASSGWTLEDTPRKMEVALKKTYKNETVTVFFTVDARQPVDDMGEEGEPEEEDQQFSSPPPVFSVLISKPNSGTVTFNCTAEFEDIYIDQVIFTKDSKLAIEDTAQADFDRTNIYPGPLLEDLDERVSESLYDYLTERLGDEKQLAEFIHNFIQFKEQSEYVNWLSDLEDFLRK